MAPNWRGQDLIDDEGAPIGRIEEIHLERDGDAARWAVVSVGATGIRTVVVPLDEAVPVENGVRVPFPRSVVVGAPPVEAGGALTDDDERRLNEHYERSAAR